jgi:hypothetical protein
MVIHFELDTFRVYQHRFSFILWIVLMEYLIDRLVGFVEAFFDPLDTLLEYSVGVLRLFREVGRIDDLGTQVYSDEFIT